MAVSNEILNAETDAAVGMIAYAVKHRSSSPELPSPRARLPPPRAARIAV